MLEQKQKPRVFTLAVPGIMCPVVCAPYVRNVLTKVEGVTSVRVDWLRKLVYLTVSSPIKDDNEYIKDFCEALEDKGYPAKTTEPHYLFKGVLSTSIAILILLLSASGFALPFWGFAIIGITSSLISAYVGRDTFLSAYRSLCYSKKLTMDSLFAVSTLLTLTVSWLALLIPGMFHLHMMFEAALLILGSRQIGLFLENKYIPYIEQITFTALAPKVVKRINPINKQKEDCQVADLIIGDEIFIPAGGVVPVDGTCENEICTYETDINGKPTPSLKTELLAGMRATETSFIMKVTKTMEDSHLSGRDKEAEKARIKKLEKESSITKEAENILQYLLPTVVAISFIIAIFIGIFFTWALAIHLMILTLTAICPCVLGFGIVLTLEIGRYKASKLDIKLKNIEYLEWLAKIELAIFDFHGTLTKGVSQKITHKIISDIDKNELYACIYALEKENKHHIAQAICKVPEIAAAANEHIFVTRLQEDKNKNGVSGIINEKTYDIGNSKFMSDRRKKGILLPETTKALEGHIIFVAVDQKIVAYFSVNDELREDLIPTLTYFCDSGIKLEICTGGNQESLNPYLKIINNKMGKNPFETITPNCADKADHVQKKKNGKKSAFIGDSANDGVVVALPNVVGIALSSPLQSKVTQANADIVIVNNENSLLKFAQSVAIAKQTLKNLRYILIFNLAYNATIVTLPTLLFVFTGILFPPYLGAVLMLSQLVLVFLAILYTYHQPVPVLNAPTLRKGVDERSESGGFEETAIKMGRLPTPHSKLPHLFKGTPTLTKGVDERSESGGFMLGVTATLPVNPPASLHSATPFVKVGENQPLM